MKKILAMFTVLIPLMSGALQAQHQLRRPMPVPQIIRPHEIRHEDKKRVELSKMLIERKNELRKEERGVGQKSREVKPHLRY